MAFLVLTRHGLEDLQANFGRLPSPLWINHGVLSDDELAQLRSDGTEVMTTAAHVDPDASEAVAAAVQSVQQRHAGPVWVERISPVAEIIGASLPPPVSDGDPDSVRTPRRSFRAVRRTIDALAGGTLASLRRLASGNSLIIIAYRGYGTPQRLMFTGRVLRDEGFAMSSGTDSGWRNLREFYKRLETDEVPGARLRARFESVEKEVVADRNGYFNVEIEPAQPLDTPGWHTVDLELINPQPMLGNKPVRAEAQVLVPPAAARFGVISDIDDTVLWTNVTNKLKMLLMLARSNAHTRKPFKGVAAFYRALHRGAGGNEGNPIFYVSSSPWNLYTQLTDFLSVQHIPSGPLLLKQLGVKTLFSSNRHHNHKLHNIERIMQTYPHLPFVLIGDSGEKDPEIYGEVVKKYPQRIRVIYIRNVNPDPSRIEAIDRLVEDVRKTGAQLILTPDSEFAAVHAAAEGLIGSDSVLDVRSDKRAEEG